MPIFPGETPISEEQIVAGHPDGQFFNESVVLLLGQIHLRRSHLTFSVVHTPVYDYLVARTLRAGVNVVGAEVFTPNPDQWWVLDPDVDETSGWVQRATFNVEGYAVPPEPTPVLPPPVRIREDPAISAMVESMDDEGDRIGVETPRPSIVTHVHEELQRQRREGNLPIGNSSVRDAVLRMREIDPKDAVYADDPALEDRMLGTNFLQATPRATYEDPEQAREAPAPPAAPVRPRSIYDRLRQNMDEVRGERPAPSVWERIAQTRRDLK